MKIRIQKITASLVILSSLAAFSGCSSWDTPASEAGEQPAIFPDYIGVTVPSNIAPMNFMIEGADRVQAVISVGGEDVLKVSGKEGVIQIPLKKWDSLMAQAAGKTIDFEVSAWSDEHKDGTAYKPFQIYVAEDEIDPWIASRLIEPGYKSWRQLGLYQRNLSTFEEKAIVTNATENETCLNCHHFPAYSSESMMFHVRGANGGTVLYHDGNLTKIKFNEIGIKRNTTYPAWHPEGRYIAFSSNSTQQIFFVNSAGLERRNDEIVNKLIGDVLDVDLTCTGLDCLFLQALKLVSLTYVAGYADDFGVIVVFLEPRNNDRCVQTAGICEYYFFDVFLFHDDDSS